MSKTIALSTHFAAFAGSPEARVTLVADAIVAAVVLAAVHGQQGGIIDALKGVSTLKGNAKSLLALREGLAATGVTLSTNGKTIAAPGLRVGKMPADAAETLATAMGESFMVAASTVLSAKVVKPAVPASEVAQKAFAALANLTAKELRKALAGNDARAVLAQLAIFAAEDVQAEAARATAEALKVASEAPAQVESPAIA